MSAAGGIDQRTAYAVAGFTSGALLAGIALTGYLLVQGAEAAPILGIDILPTDAAGWWALAGLAGACGAVAGGIGALGGWLLSRSRRFASGRARGAASGA